MLRAVLTALACLCLGGCWGSDERFFGSDDWASLDVDGEYRVESVDADETGSIVMIQSRPDGLIEIVPRAGQKPSRETLSLGFVRIRGGSGLFYLAVDRTERGTDEGDLYVLAKVSDGSLEFFFPDCAGTPPIVGLAHSEGLAGEVCDFQTKAALFEAALLAERFLTEAHIVKVTPFAKFERLEPGSEPVED
jgi:hypothetical protein